MQLVQLLEHILKLIADYTVYTGPNPQRSKL
jgi:hypothetical protein